LLLHFLFQAFQWEFALAFLFLSVKSCNLKIMDNEILTNWKILVTIDLLVYKLVTGAAQFLLFTGFVS